MTEINGYYYCGGCQTTFYTDDGIARHLCPGSDFETNLIGTQRRLERLERENKELRIWLECIKIIASYALGDSDGDGRRESDCGSHQDAER